MKLNRENVFGESKTFLAICCLVLLVASLAAAGDQPAPPPKIYPHPADDILVLKKTVRRVVVDVVVRDSDGKPVHGLTAKDFTVAEDRHSQQVLSFDVHNFETSPVVLPPDAPHLPPNVFVNVPTTAERGPLYVILYDLVNMENEDQMPARQQVLDFIRNKPAGTRFAIYSHSDGVHLIQGFTDDKDLLFAAVDPNNPKPHLPKVFMLQRNFGRGDPVSMIDVMSHLAENLDGIPGRKNLIWISGSFPMYFYPRQNDPPDLKDDIRRMVNELTRAQVAVYPVNVRGVVVNPEGAITGGSAKGGVGGAASGPSMSNTGTSLPDIQQDTGPLVYSNGGGSLMADYGSQEGIAAATGGRAFYSDNGVKNLLESALDDGANYYTLSYSPTNPNYDGRLRRIQVAVAHRGYRLAYRRSYYADDPEAPVEHPRKSESEEDMAQQLAAREQERPVLANLQHGAPQIHQLIFKVRVHPEGTPGMATPEQMAELAQQPAFTHGKSKVSKTPKPVRIQKYAIYYAIVGGQLKTSASGVPPLEFAAVAFDPDGWVANGVIEKAADQRMGNTLITRSELDGSTEPKPSQVYRAMQELEVPVNAISIRVVVRDTASDRVGSMEIPLPLAAEPAVQATTPSAPLETPTAVVRQN